MSEYHTAKEEFEERVRTIQILGDATKISRRRRKLQVAKEVGISIVKEELGDYQGSPQIFYGLDEHQRDRLIAHTREDVAAAHYLICNLLEEQETTQRHFSFLKWVVFLSFVLNCIMFASVVFYQ